MSINHYLEKSTPYKLVPHKAWELSDQSDVLKLDWNEATIDPSPLVKKALNDFIQNGKLNWYPDVNNNRLVKAIAAYNEIPEDCIQYFGSSDALHEYIVHAYALPGTKLTIVGPTYDNFRAVAQNAGLEIDFFYLDADFTFNVAAFDEHMITYKPEIVYICNPNNPTCTEYSTEKLSALLKKYPASFFIIDEAYYEFSGSTIKDHVHESDNFVICRTFSKAFALASFRIGYAISSDRNIKLLSKIRNPKNVSSLAQIAAIAALEDIAYTKKYVQEVAEAKKIFTGSLQHIFNNKVNIIEGGGNFILLQFNNGLHKKIAEHLEKNRVYIRDYSHIKATENCIRITIGTIAQMNKVCTLLEEFMNEQ